MNRPPVLTARPALPALAEAVRTAIGPVSREWASAARAELHDPDSSPIDDLGDTVEPLLMKVAAALDATDPEEIRRLLAHIPPPAVARFHQQYGFTALMREDRRLRSLTVAHAEAALGRAMDGVEASTFHAVIDAMLQRTAVALMDAHDAKLRAASERELKYLSFLSHDLHNHLSGVQIMLRLLRREMAACPGTDHAVSYIDGAEAAIHETVGGMRRLLEHEQLRKGEAGLKLRTLDARAYLVDLAAQFRHEAEAKGLRMGVADGPAFGMRTDPQLTSIVLRNLIGNAIKYCPRGRVELRGIEHPANDAAHAWTLAVADEGPGISPEHRRRIFDAFRRGDALGQDGVGLGLAIAAQAAKLLDADLQIESAPGVGSTFLLHLPRPSDA